MKRLWWRFENLFVTAATLCGFDYSDGQEESPRNDLLGGWLGGPNCYKARRCMCLSKGDRANFHLAASETGELIRGVARRSASERSTWIEIGHTYEYLITTWVHSNGITCSSVIDGVVGLLYLVAGCCYVLLVLADDLDHHKIISNGQSSSTPGNWGGVAGIVFYLIHWKKEIPGKRYIFGTSST